MIIHGNICASGETVSGNVYTTGSGANSDVAHNIP